MHELPETRESLLIAICNQADQASWQQFVAIYEPMVYRLARQMNLQDCDARDVTQQVMIRVAAAIPTWSKDERKGRFRGWLTTVAKNIIRNSITRAPREYASGGDITADIEDVRNPKNWLDQQIEEEYMRSIFRLAANRVRDEFEAASWQAFWLTAVDGKTVPAVSQQLSLSAGAIYAARSRVMRRLQQETEILLREEQL